jgi:hypothetical protein
MLGTRGMSMPTHLPIGQLMNYRRSISDDSTKKIIALTRKADLKRVATG